MAEYHKPKKTRVTVNEYAKMCGVTPMAIWNRIERGTLNVIEVPKTIIVRRIDIIENPPENKTGYRPKGSYKEKRALKEKLNQTK